MGSGNSCEKCTTTAESSVINLSDRLVGKLLEGTLDTAEIVYEEPECKKVIPDEDEEWMQKLRCIDDSHSAAYGLTQRDFNMLSERLYRKFMERMQENKVLSKGKNILMECLEMNQGCTLSCLKEINEFMKLIDLHVIQILSQKQKQEPMKSDIEECKNQEDECSE